MRKVNLLIIGIVIASAAFWLWELRADEAASFQKTEFAILRWDGRENTQLIRPTGKVEKLKPLFEKFPRPPGIDERAFYTTIALNAVAKEGYEIAAMTQDQILLKRALNK